MDDDLKKIKIDAIPCTEAIEKYIDSEEIRHEIKKAYHNPIDNFVCPDLGSIDLYTENWLAFVTSKLKILNFYAEINPGYD